MNKMNNFVKVKNDQIPCNENILCYIGDDEMCEDIGFFDMDVCDKASAGFRKVLKEEALVEDFQNYLLLKYEDCFWYFGFTYIPYERLTEEVKSKMWEFYDGYLTKEQIEDLIEKGCKCYLKGSGYAEGQLVFSNIEKMFN